MIKQSSKTKYILKRIAPILIVCSFLFFQESLCAQTKTTKEAKVIAIITDNNITALVLFENNDSKKEKLSREYPKSKFFIGLLKGRYELKGNAVIPKNETTITLFTEKQIFNTQSKLFKDKKITLGEQIIIGKVKAKVIAAKKGELIIKTNN